MSKTVLNILIEDFKAIQKDGYNITPEAVIQLLTELLPKEKENLMTAWQDGEMFGERVERDGMDTRQVIEMRNEFMNTFNQ